jgi:hypothetical protein
MLERKRLAKKYQAVPADEEQEMEMRDLEVGAEAGDDDDDGEDGNAK